MRDPELVRINLVEPHERLANLIDGTLVAHSNGRLPLGTRSKKTPMLLMGQVNAAQNGVWYVWDAGSQTRPWVLARSPRPRESK